MTRKAVPAMTSKLKLIAPGRDDRNAIMPSGAWATQASALTQYGL
jgi:hypothetical protein